MTTENMTYTPTLHAAERLEHRLGIPASEATTWFNETLRTASLLFKQPDRRGEQGVFEIEGARIIVNLRDKIVITISPEVDSSFLRPIFEREKRKLQREVTRNTRRYEVKQAELMAELARNAMNKARAKNPNTRDLIQRCIDDIEAKVKMCDVHIQREQDRLGNFDKATGAFV